MSRYVFVLSFCCLLLIGYRCTGEIQAPDQIEMGKLLYVKSTDDADVFLWTIPEGIDSHVEGDNKTLVCTGLEGTYKFGLVTLKVDWENKKIASTTQQPKTVVIGKSTPPPPPNPLTGLAKEVYDWGTSVATNQDMALKLSGNYKSVATDYNGMVLTLNQALDKLRELNGKVLDTREKKDAWAVFGSRLEERMSTNWPMEKSVMVDFLNAVSLGLSYVK